MITIGMRLTMTMMVFTQGSCVSFNTVEQALDSLKLHETDVKENVPRYRQFSNC